MASKRKQMYVVALARFGGPTPPKRTTDKADAMHDAIVYQQRGKQGRPTNLPADPAFMYVPPNLRRRPRQTGLRKRNTYT